MSHGREGVNINLFKDLIFNFSVGSNDLFGIYHLLNKIYKENDRFGRIKYCILELPYYIFNWDCSKSSRAVGRMNCYTMLEGEENQYHNLQIDQSDLLYQYYVFEQMFKERKMYNTSVCNIGIYDIKGEITNQDYMTISDIWTMQHEETISENITYFRKIISLLRQINNEMRIYITVFPQNPRFYYAHEEVINKASNCFYKIMSDHKSDNVIILDYFRFYEKKEYYFSDECHLNTLGRNSFTKELACRVELKNY